MSVASCGHPRDVFCTRCVEPPPVRSADELRAASLEAAALGHLWWGGEAGKVRYGELMQERAALISKGASK